MDHLYGPLRELTIRNENEAIASVSAQSETRINFGANSVLFGQKEAILGRFEAGCLQAYIKLAPRLIGRSFNMGAGSFASRAGGGEATCPDFGYVCSPVEPKSAPHNPGKFFD